MANVVIELAAKISDRRKQLDERFNADLRKFRKQHGDQAVNQALAVMHRHQQQRAQISAAHRRP